ncbi:MAG TPA: NUDIX domain-containing protein [Bacillota bacterium]|jgi:8-oxo-dGTP diphosphatase|nr:NUDIX domain-containing protein [Bacillota bacterium]HOL10896.1 NUDIX domain-containing protein [Bacillota bacterium]HPO98780.1 NUDIX domain-containing protein [Bacillota bacterium]
MKQLIVTAGVIVQNNRIMLAQRFDNDTEGGKWEFPGGKVEFGEEPRHSLARELKEELDIGVNVKDLIDVFSEVKDGIHLIIIYFLCEIVKGTPTPLQCQKVKWYQRDEVDRLIKPVLDENFWINHRNELLGAYL